MLINDKYALFNIKLVLRLKGEKDARSWYPMLAFNLFYFSNDDFDLLKCFTALNV